MTRPPTDAELDAIARALIPQLDAAASKALNLPHNFDNPPAREHRRKLGLRGGRQTDTLGRTDTLTIRLITVFGPKSCALGGHADASADPINLILELDPYASGRLELYLCPPHRNDLITKHRQRTLAGHAELHFAGRRILAINPRPLDVVEVLNSAASPL
jgi:hypothetical protein